MSEPTEKEISVAWPGKSVITVLLTSPPEGVTPSGYGLVLGPGAGGDEKTPLLNAVAKEVAKHGHYCARYRAKVPNLGFRVSLCTRVIEHLFHPTSGVHALKGCFLGGHSMGTRVAGTVAANLKGGPSTAQPKKSAPKGKKASPTTTSEASAAADIPPHFILGLLQFSYPLHTADNTKALRDQILLDIPTSTATLFISGNKDTMCQPTLFNMVFKDMKSSPREVIQVQDADHGLGFGSAKSSQGKKEVLASSIADWSVQFMEEVVADLEKKDRKKKVAKAGASLAVVMKKKAEVKKVADEWTVTTSTVA